MTSLERIRDREDLIRRLPLIATPIPDVPRNISWVSEYTRKVDQLNQQLVNGVKLSLSKKISSGAGLKISDQPELNSEKLLSFKNKENMFNFLIERFGFKSYLEIGFAGNSCFSNIHLVDKVGVDPHRGGTLRVTSDKFFAMNQRTFDLIFIDGLHLKEQVLRDIKNSIKCLSNGGLILVHDCLPQKEAHQLRKRQSGSWTGDVWKAIVELRTQNDLDIAVFNKFWGIAGIRVRSNAAVLTDPPALTWERFLEEKNSLLRVMEWPEFWQFLQ